MAWTTPRTWTAGETVTAALMNTHVRDNEAYLYAIANNFAPVPACRVYHDANQTIPNANLTVLSFNKERFDTDTIHDTSTNNSRLTCKTAGIYLIEGGVSFNTNGEHDVALNVLLNGATNIKQVRYRAVLAGLTKIDIGTTIYSLAVNDYVELQAFQDSGGAINAVAETNNAPVFSMAYLGKAA